MFHPDELDEDCVGEEQLGRRARVCARRRQKLGEHMAPPCPPSRREMEGKWKLRRLTHWLPLLCHALRQRNKSPLRWWRTTPCSPSSSPLLLQLALAAMTQRRLVSLAAVAGSRIEDNVLRFARAHLPQLYPGIFRIGPLCLLHSRGSAPTVGHSAIKSVSILHTLACGKHFGHEPNGVASPCSLAARNAVPSRRTSACPALVPGSSTVAPAANLGWSCVQCNSDE